jgi:hypothetical protein
MERMMPPQSAAAAAHSSSRGEHAAVPSSPAGSSRSVGGSARLKPLSAHSRGSSIAPTRVQSAIDELRQHMGEGVCLCLPDITLICQKQSANAAQDILAN